MYHWVWVKPCSGPLCTTGSMSNCFLDNRVPLGLCQTMLWVTMYHWFCVKPCCVLYCTTGSGPSLDLDYVLLVLCQAMLYYHVPWDLCQVMFWTITYRCLCLKPCYGLPCTACSVSNHALDNHVPLPLCKTMLWATMYHWFCVSLAVGYH
jgi:hypothetical protein